MTFNNLYNNSERKQRALERIYAHAHTQKLEKISAIVDKIYGI